MYLCLTVQSKISIEPAKHFGRADNRRMVHFYTTDSPRQQTSSSKFRVLSSPRLVALLKLNNPAFLTIHP